MAFEPLKFEIEEELTPKTRIRVFGVGGGGSNAVARMLQDGLAGVEFGVMNTDAQALAASPAPTKLAIGTKITAGLGAGADPSIGRQAALEDTEKIIELLEGADMVFVTAGLGGGTGTGAAPVVASLAKELGALTVAVVTKPFEFEGTRRRKQADQGLAELASVVDTVIAIPNDRILEQAPEDTSVAEGFSLADDVLRQAVQGISDIIMTPGLINRDFSDIRTIMTGMGYAMMGTATASGPKAAIAAAEKAIGCPLLDAGGISGARGVLINITASKNLRLHEVNQACSLVRKACMNDDVEINFGVVVDDTMGDEVKVTVIATGFQRENLPVIQRRNANGMMAQPVAMPAPTPISMPTPAPKPEPVPEPMDAEIAASSEPDEEEMLQIVTEIDEEVIEEEEEAAPLVMAAAAATTAKAAPKPEPEPMDELEVPAILRRDRRFLH